MLAPIEAATNISPTKVAAAVPTSRSKSCQSSMRSASEESMITEAGTPAQEWHSPALLYRELDDTSDVAVNERELGSGAGGQDAHVERCCGGGGRIPVWLARSTSSAAHRGG